MLDDRVILRNEFLDVYREVWTDGREHPADGEYTLQGHSIGWWEDDTLVVDTRYFEENPSGNGRGGTPYLIERISRHLAGDRELVRHALKLEIDRRIEINIHPCQHLVGNGRVGHLHCEFGIRNQVRRKPGVQCPTSSCFPDYGRWVESELRLKG